jgi:polysaccharide biosynthesis/export protein
VNHLRLFAGVGAALATIILGACGIVPTSGPTGMDVAAGQRDAESLPYAFVRVTPKVLEVLSRAKPRFSTAFTDRRGPEDIRFGIGDMVIVTLFEAGAGGLFIPLEAGVRPGNFITLPAQAVDSKGNISIPYAGAIRAAGRTVVEVQNAIVGALKNRALDPQAIVTLTDQRATSISVLGDGVGSIRFPANANGERVLDAITRAGLKSPGYDLWVMLDRGGRRETVPFGALIYEPTNNIYVRPQDTIFVYTEPQTFLAFGATGRQGQYPFGAWRVSLAEAAAKAGGLIDTQADAGSLFLYRGETREVAQQLGIDCAPYSGPIVPVIYQINLRDPAGYFLATTFEIRNKDVVYISNAISVDVTKFLTYVNLIVGTAQDPINYANGVVLLKNSLKSGASASAVIVGGSVAAK